MGNRVNTLNLVLLSEEQRSQVDDRQADGANALFKQALKSALRARAHGT